MTPEETKLPDEKPKEEEKEVSTILEKKPDIKSEILDAIKEKLSDLIIDSKVQRERRLLISIQGKDLLKVCKILKKMDFDHLSSIAAVEYDDRFEVVYTFWSYSNNNLLILKSRLPKDSPTVDSLTSLWRSANWHEREAFDLMGITFNKHPDLRRIFNSDDFDAFPLRKSFTLPDRSAWSAEEK